HLEMSCCSWGFIPCHRDYEADSGTLLPSVLGARDRDEPRRSVRALLAETRFAFVSALARDLPLRCRIFRERSGLRCALPLLVHESAHMQRATKSNDREADESTIGGRVYKTDCPAFERRDSSDSDAAARATPMEESGERRRYRRCGFRETRRGPSQSKGC